jgi:hypothetical protein
MDLAVWFSPEHDRRKNGFAPNAAKIKPIPERTASPFLIRSNPLTEQDALAAVLPEKRRLKLERTPLLSGKCLNFPPIMNK